MYFLTQPIVRCKETVFNTYAKHPPSVDGFFYRYFLDSSANYHPIYR